MKVEKEILMNNFLLILCQESMIFAHFDMHGQFQYGYTHSNILTYKRIVMNFPSYKLRFGQFLHSTYE